MISSRCNDPFPNPSGRQLSDIRREIKTEIESLKVFDKEVFEVWINEDTAPQPGTQDSWEVCLQAVKDCDIFIALYNGNAGWAKEGGDIGICHAEYMRGRSLASGKVWTVALEGEANNDETSAEGLRNKRFQEYVHKQDPFRGGIVTTEEELKIRVKETLHGALLSLAKGGVRDASKGKFHSGEALDWSRLDFRTRREEMQKVLYDQMLQRTGSTEVDNRLIVKISGYNILTIPDAIPAALTVSAAKELVGQPFLLDHELAAFLNKSRGGPLHIIGCHKNATESQAIKLLGFPDATVVSAPFGIFVADNIQKVQFAFLVNCRDETTTRYSLQQFFEWLSQTGEDVLVAERAQSRARIVAAIAKENMNDS